jgi:hypothetical protein
MIHIPASTLRPRPSIVWAFFTYAFAVRVLPYVLHEATGLPLKNTSDLYPWNFSPLYALALFGGAALSVRVATLAPLATLVVGDLVIAAVSGGEWGFYPAQGFNYLAILAVTACGLPLRVRPKVANIALGGLSGATAFFVVSNFGVWVTRGGYVRPLTPSGLAMCYADAIPFFGPTVLSIAVFLPVLFSPLVLRSEHSLASGTAT